ncbi:MAG: hypothetical protein AAFX94_00475 [Myxococcota bacterium]
MLIGAARRAKLVWELRGDRLDADDKAFARRLYEDYPGDFDGCVADSGTPVPQWPSACGIGAAGQIRRCARLSSSHSALAVAEEEMGSCFGLMDGLNETCVSALAEGQQTRLTTEVLNRLAERFVDGITSERSDTPNASASSIDRALAAIDGWYEARIALGTNDEELFPEASRLLGRFWRAAYAAGGATVQGFGPSTPEDEVANSLASSRSASLEVDRRVLTSAASGARVDSPLLTLLMADALRQLASRLDSLAAYQDLGCKLSGSCEERPDEFRELLELLSVVHDHRQLSERLNGPATLVRQRYRDVFSAVAESGASGRLRRALERFGEFEDFLRIDADRLARPLQVIVEGARTLLNRRDRTGLYKPDPRPELSFAFVQGRVGRVIEAVQTKARTIDDELDEFATETRANANELITLVAKSGAEKNAESRAEQQLARFSFLAQTSETLKRRESNAEMELGGFLRVFKELADSESGWVFPETPIAFNVTAADARFEGGRRRVDEVAITPRGSWAGTLEVEPGDVLSITTGGEYAPDCVLRELDQAKPLVPRYTGPAMTGPGGYTVSWTNNAFTAESTTTTEENANSESATVSACQNKIGDIIGLGLSIQACGEMNWSRVDRNVETTEDGTRRGQSMNFSAGLKLENVPFVGAPVGALLAVQSKPGKPNSILAVDVIRPATMLVIDEFAVLRFVVNDRRCGNSDRSALGVTVSRATSLEGIADELSDSMVATFKKVRKQRDEVAQRGRLLPAEVAALRSDAFLDLTRVRDFDEFPASLRRLYSAWLDKEIASIERLGRIVELEREQQLLSLEIQTLVDEADNYALQSRLSTLLPLWSLRELAAWKLGVELEDYMSFFNEFVLPVLELRYPNALEELRRREGEVVAQLRALELDGSLVDSARVLSQLADRVAEVLANASLRESVHNGELVLAFPNPNYTPPPAAIPEKTQFGQVGPERARRAWAQVVYKECTDSDGSSTVCAQGDLELTVEPRDLYATNVGNGRLPCNCLQPVTRAVGVHFNLQQKDNQDGDLDAALSLKATLQSESLFPDSDVMRSYWVDDTQISFAPRATLGLDISAVKRFRDALSQTPARGSGHSPFTTFRISLPTLEAAQFVDNATFSDISEVLIMMKVDCAIGRPISYVETCR